MSILLRVFSIVLITLIPLSVFAGSTEGRLAYRKGDYSAALREFGSGVESGPIGRFFLALMYLRGEGVARDQNRGLVLLRSSADDGYFAAQYLLGQYLLYGQGLPKDRALAMSYLLAASNDDDSRAVVLLKILEKGSRGHKKDQEQIVAEVKRRAKAKDANAQYTLAFMYLTADGVPKSSAEEVRWYRVAAAKSSRAAFMLSLMYEYGEDVPKNPVEAFRLMQIAAQLGDGRAQYYLATFCHQGIGIQVDRQAAAAWFRLSAENGYADAQLAYGMILLSGDGVAQDKSQAIEWLSKAAQQNNDKAKEIVAELLTYRGQTTHASLKDLATASQNAEKKPDDKQLRLEGNGVILDEGTFGLKFSLPTLYDAYAPQNLTTVHPLWDRLQGGIVDIIIRPPK